jgi:hypothetical protein
MTKDSDLQTMTLQDSTEFGFVPPPARRP